MALVCNRGTTICGRSDRNGSRSATRCHVFRRAASCRLHKPGTLRVERRDGMLLGYIDVRRAWWLPSIADKAA